MRWVVVPVHEVLQPYLDSWLKRRLPKAQQTTLNQHKIFIVPAKLALGMLGLIALLFMLAINFQNSLVYAVCFWLLALLVVNILHTYRNLSGLTLTALSVAPCFAGENAVLEVELSRPEKQKKYALQLGWPGHDWVEVNLDSQQTMRVCLSHPTKQRGRFAIPGLQIETRYPTRLAVAWSYVTPDSSGLVYPTPQAYAPPETPDAGRPQDDGAKPVSHGSHDFGGIRDYQPGDTPRHIHWGKYAQTGELYTKSFVDDAGGALWLNWETLTFPGTEARLSHLCRRVLECHAARRQYGLNIPGTRIEPGTGEVHQHRCLTALSLFGDE